VALLRRVIGDALRARRQGQRRTLREVSTAANVSLGYLSEVERGQKEASSELLASICEALGSQLSEVLRDATDSLVRAEGNGGRADAGRVEAGRVGAGRAGGELSAVALGGPVRPDGSLAERAVAEVPQPGTGKLAQVTRPRLAAGDPDSPTRTVTDGEVSVSVRRNGPFRTTLHTIRTRRADQPVTRAG
jgi:transcriptional regulator with XRE-family HTH domain